MSGNTNYGSNTSDTKGTNTTSFGADVLSNIVTSTANNTGVGAYSLLSNTSGTSNVAFGTNSLLKNTTGSFNTSVGTAALVFNTTGNANVAVGSNSLEYNTSGYSNISVGTQTLYNNLIGSENTSVGNSSQYGNTSGSFNVSLGNESLRNNISNNNTSVGYGSMYTNTTGTENISVGTDSFNLNTTGSYNVALGVDSGSNNTNGNYNTFVGHNSGSSGSTGSYCTAIGYNSKFSDNNQIVLGTTAEKVIVPGILQFGNTSGNVTSGVTGAVYYNPMEQSIYFSNGNTWRSTALTVEPSILATDLYPGGATISLGLTGSVIQMGFANASNPGVVSTTIQTFAGAKTFTGGITGSAITLSTTVSDVDGGIYYNYSSSGASGLFIKAPGNPAVSVKSFIIDHPTDKEKYLIHGCLEGPESGVYYRGTDKITNGESVVVKLPSYVEKLAHDFTVQVTPIYNGKINVCNVSRVKEGQFTVYGTKCEFDWVVYASRGAIGVEPKKTDVVVKGDGPYKYTA